MSSLRSRSRRHRDRHHVEPVVEVLAEFLARDRLFEVLVGGGDQANVDLDRARSAEPLELTLLQHAQDLGLGRGRHVADLVEEQRAFVRQLEPADALAVGTGEGAALVAEELGLEQVLVNCRAVSSDEGRSARLESDGAPPLPAPPTPVLARLSTVRFEREDLLDGAEDLLHLRHSPTCLEARTI
jgi:hypothetical protein